MRRFLLLLLLALSVAGATAVTTAPVRAEDEIVCGDEEEPMPELDEDGFIAEPDTSTEEERAGDYDDSAEDQAIPEDEGDELTPEERAALGRCLERALTATWTRVARAIDDPWRGRRARALATVGYEELPYGGAAELSLKAGGVRLGRAALTLRSGDSGKLRLRLNRRARRALRREGRIVAVARLKLTDGLDGRSQMRSGRVVLRRR